MNEIAIQAKHIYKKFGDFIAVSDVSINVNKSEIYGFLGPNGSGKSTVIRMLTGLLSPTKGKICVLGLELPKASEKLKHEIGYMTQKFSLYTNLTTLENLNFVAKIYFKQAKQQTKQVNQALSEYNLGPIANRMVSQLSGGQKQRLALATATLHNPKLLFLDEPTSAVDPESRRQFWEKLYHLSSLGTTILVSTHFMDEAERCHKLAILDKGRLRAQNSPQVLIEGLNINIVEVSGSNLANTKSLITSQPNIYSVTQIGNRLRVLIDKQIEQPEIMIKNVLKLKENKCQINLTRPNLEDVFVWHTSKRDQVHDIT